MIRQDRSICVARNESPIRHLFYKSQKQWKAQTAADADARYPFVEIVIIDADGLRTGLNHHLLDLWPSCFPVCLDHKEINSASAIQRRIIMAPIVLITYIMPHSTRSAFRIHSQHHEMLWFHNQFMNSLTLTPTPAPASYHSYRLSIPKDSTIHHCAHRPNLNQTMDWFKINIDH